MKISLSWLKDYLPLNASVEDVVYTLTMAGLEVERAEQLKGDAVLELEITPNRADCLSVIGVARELGAVFKKDLKLPKIKKISSSGKFTVVIDDKKDCPYYSAVRVEGIKVSAQNGQIQERLKTIGLRTINNIVDITNFCLMEQGQPLHAFDADKLDGDKIIVRRAKAGEKIVTIDGVERTLDPSVLVIADSKKAVAIAGVMGGKETEVTQQTKNILLESAVFDPVLIRRTSRKLGLSSDSSYRFERGVDHENVWPTAERAIGLIIEEAGGRVIKKGSTVALKNISKTITLSVDQINGRLGTKLSIKECADVLTRLGVKCARNKTGLRLVPPSFRPDLNKPVDAIEEIVRVVGYDNIPMSHPGVSVSFLTEDSRYTQRKNIRNFLISQGLDEIVTYSMINGALLKKACQETLEGIKIKNPLSADQELMRPSLLPNLLSVAQLNMHKGTKTFKFFEMGKIYIQGHEEDTLGMVLAGTNNIDWRQEKSRAVDYFDLKGIAEALLAKLHIIDGSFEKIEDEIFENGQAVSLKLGAHIIGCLGKLSAQVLENFDIKTGPLVFCQLSLEKIYPHTKVKRIFEPLSDYPSIVRDVSISVSKEVPYKTIEQTVFAQGGGLLKNVKFVEQYLGEKIPQGQRGLIFSLNYQLADRTLKETEVQPIHERILKLLSEQFKATIR